VTRGSGEGDGIAHVFHAGDVIEQALEAEAKTSVSVVTGARIPEGDVRDGALDPAPIADRPTT